MKNTFLAIAFVFASSVAFANLSSGNSAQVILKLKNESSLAALSSAEKKIYTGCSSVDEISRQFNSLSVQRIALGKKSAQAVFVVKFPAGTDINKAISSYLASDKVEYAEPDHIGSASGAQGITPNDQYFSRQYGLKNNGSFSLSPAIAGADIEMENAWNIETGDTSVVVATIDSGCKLDHPEFAGRIWKNYGEIASNSTDDDNNGKVDDVQGWDFANNDNNPTDDHGHGTNVTGIIGANGNNSIGYARVDWKSKQMILKGLDNTGFGYYSWWADAIYYAVDNGARVINMSLAGQSSSTTLQNAITYAFNNNVLVVVCMGNDNSGTPVYPANCTNVLAVGSTNPNDTRTNPFFWSSTSGSNYGSHISVVAPGNYIYGLDHTSNTNYNSYWGGTSQATPHVAGLAALLIAQDPSRTPATLKSIIETTAEDQVGNPSEDVAGFDIYYGHGRINAFLALSLSTAMEENGASVSFEVFPNPSSGNINILLANARPEKALLSIRNSLGQEIAAEELDKQKSSLSLPPSPGIYFIAVMQNGNTSVRKIICR